MSGALSLSPAITFLMRCATPRVWTQGTAVLSSTIKEEHHVASESNA
jgi:hypothetical protein